VAVSGYTVVVPGLADGAAPEVEAQFSLYQKNMLFKMPDVAPLRDDILALAPDFVTLQEVSARNRWVLKDLKPAYPAQQFCAAPTIADVAVLSKWPKIAGSGRCDRRVGLAIMRVRWA
jgi:endonuclease/exonuclease/phosphatase (EEP) superfamily protein YafD